MVMTESWEMIAEMLKTDTLTAFENHTRVRGTRESLIQGRNFSPRLCLNRKTQPFLNILK